ncbi:MAG TPA: pilus assembly protein TadG-related protein [Stellaceae bacterium]|nr:pilus assembly protein TadG-related protein [Stellaceae bacterium]
MRPELMRGLSRCKAARTLIAGLARERGGAVAVIIALSLAGIIGFAGLGTEVASWYTVKRHMQGAADSAAATAAAALAAGEPDTALDGEAKSVAALYGFADGSNSVTVTVNSPPESGDYQSSPAVEVIISQPQTARLTALYMRTGPTITARAVALADTSKTGEACVVALDPINEPAMVVSGSTPLNFPGCSLYVNSPSPSALTMNGGATIHANIAYLVGGISGSGVTANNGIYTGVNPLIDPYLNAAVPAYSGCDSNGYKMNAGTTDTKTVGASGVYVFCNGLTLTGGSTLNLGPGTFIIDRGQLSISGNSSLIATSGTTIILTTSDPTKACATASISGGTNFQLAAPSSGPLAGLALFQDRACTDTTASNSLTGGSTQNIVGAIYFPGEPVNYAGGSPVGGAQCTQLIAWTIDFTGSANFNNDCTGTGVRSTSLTGGRLVE